MSNDSREAPQIIKASDNIFEDFYDKPRAEILAQLSQFLIDNDFSGLVKYFDAAQSRHAAEREALEKDAARYRLLRSMTWDAGVMCVVVEPKENLRLGSYCPSQKLLDEALDALLSDSGSQG